VKETWTEIKGEIRDLRILHANFSTLFSIMDGTARQRSIRKMNNPAKKLNLTESIEHSTKNNRMQILFIHTTNFFQDTTYVSPQNRSQ
jgi:hypothetical protein